MKPKCADKLFNPITTYEMSIVKLFEMPGGNSMIKSSFNNVNIFMLNGLPVARGTVMS